MCDAWSWLVTSPTLADAQQAVALTAPQHKLSLELKGTVSPEMCMS